MIYNILLIVEIDCRGIDWNVVLITMVYRKITFDNANMDWWHSRKHAVDNLPFKNRSVLTAMTIYDLMLIRLSVDHVMVCCENSSLIIYKLDNRN